MTKSSSNPIAVTYHSIMCMCGSRRTKRVGKRLYMCMSCGVTNMMFVGNEGVFTLPVRLGLELERERQTVKVAS